MTIHGINPGLGAVGLPRVDRGDQSEAAEAHVRSPRESIAVAYGTPSTRAAVPGPSVEAPQGTDPALWSVLTPEERAFFARARETGPLMYGRGTDPSALSGMRIGGRIDVKV